MHQVAVGIPQDLYFDVPRPPDELLEIDLVLAEGGFGFAPRRATLSMSCDESSTMRMPRPPPPQLAFSITGKPTAPAMARISLSSPERRRRRHHRHSGGGREIARLHLVSQPAHGVGCGTHEDDVGRRAGFGKLGDFPTGNRSPDVPRRRGPRRRCVRCRLCRDRHRSDPGLRPPGNFRRLGPVQREPVFLRVNGDGANAEFRRGAHDAYGDFAAIRDEKALDCARLGNGFIGE